MRVSAKAARRTAGAAAILAVAALGGVSEFTTHARVCEDAVVRIGTEPTVRSCRPMELTDPPIVVLAVAAAAAFAADLSEVSVFGIGWKRRVEARQADLASSLNSLQQVVNSQSQTQAVYVNQVDQALLKRELDGALESLEAKMTAAGSLPADLGTEHRPDAGDEREG